MKIIVKKVYCTLHEEQKSLSIDLSTMQMISIDGKELTCFELFLVVLNAYVKFEYEKNENWLTNNFCLVRFSLT